MRKVVVWLVAAAALGGLGWLVYRKLTRPAQAAGARRQGGAVPVELEPVRRATLHRVERLTGTLRARAEFVVAPKIAGRLEKLLVNIGDPVKPNQLLAVLDAAEAEEAVAQAKAELAVARANAEQVRLGATLEDEELAQKAAQAKAEWAVARANADQVRLGAVLEDAELAQKLAQAQAELGSAKANLEDARSALTVAQRELERAQALREKKIMSQAEFDTADAQFKAAKAKQEAAVAQVTQREAAVKSAQVRLSDTQKGAREAELRHATSLAEQKEAAYKTAMVRLSETQKGARAAELALALAQVTNKEAALKAALVRFSYTQIKVPPWEDGQEPQFVGERFVDEGAMLKANDAIVSVLDIRILKALVHVAERDYMKVKVGQDVAVATDGVPGKTFAGKVVRVAPMLRESSRQALVEIEVPNPERVLKPGMFIRAEIELERRVDVTAVPRDAIVRRSNKQGVFVADKAARKAIFTPVTPGIEDKGLVEVLDPPKALAGASVVALGHHLLEDGSAITLPDDKEGLTQRPQSKAEKTGEQTKPDGLKSKIGNRKSEIK
ncbi:MAG: efflux RND transporter periplasmic adaptor subunit [Planctomycetes bacterium]|nr:efflux RND transporter periplasmic adaptor subunit [Planctomycetota bacterium]